MRILTLERPRDTMSEIVKNLRYDLAEYLRLPYGVANRPMELIGELAKEEWNNLNPRNPQEENFFYLHTQHYLQECSDWHDRDATVRKWNDTLLEYADKLNWQYVLDYGAGIATPALVLAEESDVETIVIADFDCPALNFAAWKAHKYGLEHRTIWRVFDTDLVVQPVENQYDCIICTDVIGHSNAPYAMLAEIMTHTTYVLWNGDFRVSNADRYPMHHTKPRGWDGVWGLVAQPVASFLFNSKVTGQSVDELTQRWRRM